MAKARPVLSPKPVVEELHFRSDNAFLCLLLNRRTRTIRVIDFRAGALPAKRLFIQSIALREKVDKVIILVEKDGSPPPAGAATRAPGRSAPAASTSPPSGAGSS
jgi:hypothetical protein